MSNPNQIVVTIKLQPCCQKTLGEIKDVLELGKILHAVVAIAPFALLFGVKLKPSPNSMVSFANRDWDLWEKSMSSATKITRNTCKKLCELHLLDHRKDRSERIFWSKMADSFS